MQVVNLQNIHFVRSGKLILKGVSWAIDRGQHWALLGANGSGKTTLLRILTGYLWASEGSVVVLSERYGEVNLRQLRKKIGWVSVALEQRIPGADTSVEVVASGLEASLGVYREINSGEWERAHRALSRVSALGLAEQTFGTLSQGEQQRVMIARALISEPVLLILDEPCAGLDPVARVGFLDILHDLANQPQAPTLIMVTHHIEEIATWISHIHAIKDGETVAQGPVCEVLTSSVLAETFSRPCKVIREQASYRLHIEHPNRA